MSDATDDASRWSWLTADGKVTSGAKGELMLALRSEKLAPTTFVWRPTWAEWLPASRVAELSGVLPASKVEAPQVAKRSATQLSPPALPVPGASVPAPAAPSVPPPAPVRSKAAVSQPPPPPMRSSAGAQGRPRGVSILGPPRDQMMITQPMRAPIPTLGGEEGVPFRSTLRPPGAVPPPARTGFGPAPHPRAEEEMPTQRRLLPPSETHSDTFPDIDVVAPTELRPAIVTPHAKEPLPAPGASVETQAALARPLPPSQDFDVTLGSTPFESAAARKAPPSTTLESIAAAPPPPSVDEPEPTLQQWMSLDLPKRAQITLAFFGGAIVIAAGVFFIFIVASTKSHEAASAASAAAAELAAATPSGEASTAPKGCRLLEPAARLATTVERSVQPAFAELVPHERVAVGFAPTPKSAAGLLVRLDTLDAVRPFEQAADAATRGVVPLVKAGKTTFFVDHADSELSGARTVSEGVMLGFAGPDLVQMSGSKKSVVWPGAASDKTTDPHLASSSGGTLVTFRRGGLGGQVLYGWLGKDGGAAGLVAIDAAHVKFSGTPDAAANGRVGVIAFAGRAAEGADWRIQLAKVSQTGKASARTFEPPAGGSGGGNIAPAVTALGGDGWLLQWTEGGSGQYQVRLARLGQDLELLGDARLVSPKGANAGQGSVFATGSRVLSVFVQTTAGHDELWGASFECF